MEILVSIIGYAVVVIAYVGIIAVDITLFFLLAHVLARKWPQPLFSRFDKIGSPIIEPLINATQRIGRFSNHTCFWISLALSISRLFLTSIVHAMLVT